MIIKMEKENDRINAEVKFTNEELRSSFTDPIKLQLLILMEIMTQNTLSNLYAILMQEETEGEE